MKDRQPSALRRGLSVMGKLLAGTRKGPSGDRVRQLKKFQRKIGITFTDLGLLEQALTHRSYSHVTSQTRNESNERMEFLGDSVLGLAVSQFLYLQFPDRSEGALSKMKSLLVSRKVLSTVARDAGLGEFLLLSGEESEMGGRDRASILADSFEGVIGAIYLDQGFRAANKYIQRFLLAEIHEILKDEEHTNFKSLLQEHVQSKRLSHPVYRVRREEGPEHEKEFAIEVVVRGDVWGVGRGKSKKDAEQNAARAALESRQSREPQQRRRGAREESRPEAPRSKPPEMPRAKPELPRTRGEAVRTKPEAGVPRSPDRPRIREIVPGPPKDRGDHGILASREQLRAARRAEAEQREREDREERPRREERAPGGERRRVPDATRRREPRQPRPSTAAPTETAAPLEVEAMSVEATSDHEVRESPTRESRETPSRPWTPREDAPRNRPPRGSVPQGTAVVPGSGVEPGSAPGAPREGAGYGRRRRHRRGSGEGSPRPRPEVVKSPASEATTTTPVPEAAESRHSAPPAETPARDFPPAEPLRESTLFEPAPPSAAPTETAGPSWSSLGAGPSPSMEPPPSEDTATEPGPADPVFEPEGTHPSEDAGMERVAGGFERRKRKHGRGLRRR